MGKYDGKLNGLKIQEAEITVKKFIANELAEMNRLKRLEMALANTQTTKILELNDQA